MISRVVAKLMNGVSLAKLVTGEEIVFVMMQNLPKQGIHVAFPYLLTKMPWPSGDDIVEVPVLQQFCEWANNRDGVYISFSDIVLTSSIENYHAKLYLENLERTEPEGYAKLLTVVEEQIRRSDQAKSTKSAADYEARH